MQGYKAPLAVIGHIFQTTYSSNERTSNWITGNSNWTVGNSSESDLHEDYNCKKLTDEVDLQNTLYFGATVIIGVIVIGGITNFLTLCCLWHQFFLPKIYRHVNTDASTILIINLALADLVYSVICLPPVFYIYIQILSNENTCPSTLEHDKEPFNTICKYAAFIRYGTAITEWSTIGLMAFERYMAICRFATYRSPSTFFTAKKTIIYCIVIWLVGLTLQLPSLIGHSDFFLAFGYNGDTLKCDFVYDSKSTSGCPGFDVRDFFFLIQASVPSVFIVLSYYAINRTVQRTHKVISQFTPRLSIRTLDIRKSRSTMIYVKIVSIFLICVMPMCFWNIFINICRLGDTPAQISGIIVYCIYWMQYAINNFLYVVSFPKYRQTYKQFLNRVTCQKIKPPEKLRIIPARRFTKPTIFTIQDGYQQMNISVVTESKTDGHISFQMRNFKPPKLAFPDIEGAEPYKWTHSENVCLCRADRGVCLKCKMAAAKKRKRSASFSGYESNLDINRNRKLSRQFSH